MKSTEINQGVFVICVSFVVFEAERGPWAVDTYGS